MTNQERLKALHDAMEEASRFHRRAVELETILQDRIERKDTYPYATVAMANCKRASMDLTRALATFRSRY